MMACCCKVRVGRTFAVVLCVIVVMGEWLAFAAVPGSQFCTAPLQAMRALIDLVWVDEGLKVDAGSLDGGNNAGTAGGLVRYAAARPGS